MTRSDTERGDTEQGDTEPGARGPPPRRPARALEPAFWAAVSRVVSSVVLSFLAAYMLSPAILLAGASLLPDTVQPQYLAIRLVPLLFAVFLWASFRFRWFGDGPQS